MINRKIVFLLAFLNCYIAGAQSVSKKIEYIDVFVFSLQAMTPYPMELRELSDSSYFAFEITDKVFLEDIAKYLDALKERKPKKFYLDNFRVLLAIKYEDGSVGYVAKNTLPFVLYNNNVYKDKQHMIYRMLNRYEKKIKTIDIFLYEYDKYINKYPIK